VAARQLSVPRRQIIDGLQQSNAERDNRHQMRHCRGAAGLMLGYLLARAGVDVAMLEKPADFFRDFRGGTIHPSTLSRKLFERFLRDVNKLPGAPAWAGRRPQGPTRQTQFGTPQPAPEAQCTTLGVSGRKGVLPPQSAAPTSTSSIDTAVLLDRSSSCCVRAVRAQASSSVAYGGTVWGFGHNVHQFIDLTVVAPNTTVSVT
jgi:hypothetical protein